MNARLTCPSPCRILSYARKLKEENEAARRKLVEDLEERRFRQGSDVLRARQSKIMAERVALDRVAQLQEKAVREEQKYVQQAAESAMLDDEARAVSAMRAAELEARKRLEAEMRTVLDQQVQVKRELQAKDAHFDSRSVQAMLEADKAAAEAQRREADQRRSSAREEYERTQVFNATWKDVKDRAAKAEYEADKADLDNALARAAAEAQAEREAAAARRRDALAFKQRLEEQMSLQAEDKGWLERFYAEEGEKEWSKRQAKWDAEAQARKGLMDDVARTRLQQMEDKKMRAAMEGKDDAAQLQYFAQLQARADEEERQRQAKRQQQQLLAFEMARRQMEENERARAANKQQEYLEWRSQQKFEREYQARVDRLLQEGGPGLGGTAGGTQQGMGVTGVSMGMASTRR